MDQAFSNIETLTDQRLDDVMSNELITLILGGTGKTGRRIADLLGAAGLQVRTAARSNADVTFDWADEATWSPALEGVAAIYLVPPAGSLDFAPTVRRLLDAAEQAGVRHVTFLSARGVEFAPAEAPLRAVELDLQARPGLTATILRPGWFFQNFSEYVFLPAIVNEGVIAAPAGDGAEAFVDADDIAAVAAATLRDPSSHAGAEYALTGPTAHSFGDVAARISAAVGRPIVHVDEAGDAWVQRMAAIGLPAEYAAMLVGLLDEHVRNGHGATTTDDIDRVTRRRPRSLDDYVAEVAATGVWSRRA